LLELTKLSMRFDHTTFMHRLRTAYVEPDDSDELRLRKSLLVFVSSLVCVAAGVWLLIYWAVGPRLSASLPLCLQLVVATNLIVYARWGHFNTFRQAQLSILLFFPFIAQWALGDFITASGLILWGMLAPICALLCCGLRESVSWFVIYIILALTTGISDSLQADVVMAANSVPRRVSVLFFVLNFATISTLIYLLLHYALREKDRIQSMLGDAHLKLEKEQIRSEQLLLNVLPASVATRLKNSDDIVADGFPEVTIMFADIVNFTEMAVGMSPVRVFALLNHIFGKFDDLVEESGLEKIKTIGDAYMVAGGLDARLEDPCAAMADLALAMTRWLEEEKTPDGQALRVRIGISTGPAVAGVVGRKKFMYDVWGDTVNLASRITSEVPPGTIQCDAKTFSHLKYRFVFEDPVTLRLKGKGMVSVWHLLGRAKDNPTTLSKLPSYPLDLDFSTEE
jgi:adenylate cyclase